MTFSSIMNKPLLFALTVASFFSSAHAQCGEALGVGALNNCNFFVFDGDAEFTCQQTGSRCGLDRNDYGIDPVANGGNFVDQLAGTVWTNSRGLSDILEIGSCTDGGCVVYCFSDCTCVDLDTGNNCRTTTPMPTPSPMVTPAPTPYNCPKKLGTEHCHKLMTEHFPTTDPGCDCYNFCKGQFQSCCNALSGTCGDLQCDVAEGIAEGTIESNVWGCTRDDMNANNNKNNNNGKSSGAAVPSTTRVGGILAGVGAMAALAL